MEEKRELKPDEMKKVFGGTQNPEGDDYYHVYMYPCPFCNEEFVEHSDLLTHVQTAHKDMID